MRLWNHSWNPTMNGMGVRLGRSGGLPGKVCREGRGVAWCLGAQLPVNHVTWGACALGKRSREGKIDS